MPKHHLEHLLSHTSLLVLELSTISIEAFQMAVSQIAQIENRITFTTKITCLAPNFLFIGLLQSDPLPVVFANRNKAVRCNEDRYFRVLTAKSLK